ncbi:MAG: preprotein translocase subunit YajC [Firmicutes bacterium]|nr:preprotein translocase subunit YajC [Bacillota bacterium]
MNTTSTAATGIGSYSSLILLAAMFAVMYLMIIRPQRKKEKETEAMRNSLGVGDEIVTIGGFFGKIVRVKNDRLVIQCGADRTRLEIARWAVSAVVNKAGSETKAEAPTEEEELPSRPTPKSIKRLDKSGDPAEKTE